MLHFPIVSLLESTKTISADRESERDAHSQGEKLRRPIISLSALPNLCLPRVFSRMVFWVFGYGSLVWNPGFEVDEKVIGFIKGYKRVFDLACIDHRGTPDHPARTCTLEENEEAICWGAAYRVGGGPEKEMAAMKYLERRECEYDQKTLVDFYKEGDSEHPFVTGVIVFTSTPDKISNMYYLGPAPLEDMARQIATAFGPCGNNRDYLFLLEKAMFDIGHEDDYVIELANEVRKVLVSLSGSADIPLKASLSPLKLKPLVGA